MTMPSITLMTTVTTMCTQPIPMQIIRMGRKVPVKQKSIN
jgi:hypothetical protein